MVCEQNQESGLNWAKTLSSEPGFSLVITWGVIRVTVSESGHPVRQVSFIYTLKSQIKTNKQKKHAQHLWSVFGPSGQWHWPANEITVYWWTNAPPPPLLLLLRLLPSLLTEWSQISSSNSRVSCTVRLLEANVRFVKNGFDQLLFPILSTTAKRGLPCDTRYSRCRTDFDSRVRQNEWWREEDECGRQVGGGWGCFDVGNMSLKPVSFVMCFKRFHAWAEFFTLYTPPATCASLWCKNKFP